MSATEVTIDATLDANGQLQLAHQPQLPPGSVTVTIRAVAPGSRRGLADVIREIRADQVARGFTGLTPEQLRQREAESKRRTTSTTR